ncbi:MAG: glutamine-hydrolyzing carbamoyl-phosphate synthase small subunit [Candidatus Altiarchaeales archaeon]|nr:glutamine-hydrolyzing carbamoyl-phosphate synthase small subunit [Candidatus Altiarchaeales archaeon]
MDENNAVLVLQDGTVIWGVGFGAEGSAEGEVVFNTSMSGYQEALTDPSYKYQVLMMTYPLVGNYGVNDKDFESEGIQTEAFIIRELTRSPSHGKLRNTLDEFLKEYDIPGIQGIDTRFLTKKIRMHGVMNGILKYPCEEGEIEDLKGKAAGLRSISDLDLVGIVSAKKPKKYDACGKKTVVLVDCGVKQSIIRCLLDRQINVVQVPAGTSAAGILDYEPDGILVSNGPGDPERADYVGDTVKKLISEGIPMFGICLGLQIMGLACGARTYKLKFGHRGSNHPVKDLETGRAHITSQNHGFAVDAESLPEDIRVSHISLNDGSVEGFIHKELPIRAVQYHPEAHPGPWYNYYIFDEFMELMK